MAALSARGPVFLFRQLTAQFESSPAPLRLLLLPRPDQKLSVQLLKRRGPVLAMPLLLDLPQPVTAIRLKPSAARDEQTGPAASMLTVHARHTEPAQSEPLAQAALRQH